MTRKKRVYQWVIVNRFDEVTHCYDSKECCQDALLGNNDAEGCRVVRLVEYDARKEAVVRAAIQWTHLALDRSTTGSPGRADAYDALLRAVKKLEGGKK